MQSALRRVTEPVRYAWVDGEAAVFREGHILFGEAADARGYPLAGVVPPLPPHAFGHRIFKSDHGLKYAYIAGAMAGGITSAEMVEAAGRAGMLGFFGAAGLTPAEVEAAVDRLQQSESRFPVGFNLIHSPTDPELETAVSSLYIRRGVRRVSASAYMDVTPALIRYRLHGIYRDDAGRVICPNRVIAKVSRVEVARKFFSPPPEKIVAYLKDRGEITETQAAMSREIPVAHDLTAEADSGGHTDNRPAISLLPTMIALKNKMNARYAYDRPLLAGLGGGVATPESTAAAFAMGAAWVVTGSVNQSCVEAGVSESVRKMLAGAHQADVTMAPSADMFEMGGKVQVLKRGTMFPMRASKLYECYCRYGCLDEIPEAERLTLERDLFRCSLADEWQNTRRFFENRDPRQIERADADARHKMALIFRSYLGRASRWAMAGDPERTIDYQIWCGPSMGAFNEWVRGSFLETPENRDVVTVAMNLMYGAAVITRRNMLTLQGAVIPESAEVVRPLPLSEINRFVNP